MRSGEREGTILVGGELVDANGSGSGLMELSGSASGNMAR